MKFVNYDNPSEKSVAVTFTRCHSNTLQVTWR